MSQPDFSFKLEPEIFEVTPQAKVGAILIQDLQPRSDVDTRQLLAKLKANALDAVVRKNKAYDELPGIKSWLRLFEKLGLNSKKVLPAHAALYKRVQSDKTIPSINLLVDIYNAFSLIYMLPIGGHDITDKSSIRVGLTSGDEKYLPIGSDQEETVEDGEFAYIDNNNQVLTRNLVWRQSEYSKITDTTTDLFIPLDDLTNDLSQEQLTGIINEFIEILANFYQFKYSSAIVDKYSPEFKPTNSIEAASSNRNYLLIRPEIDNSPESVSKFFDHKLDEIYPSRDEFEQALLSGQRLRFYIGADATGPRLHIGHLVPVQKLAQLQALGHEIIFLIGDFTSRIGDPTDKSATRVQLSEEEVAKNAASYKEQIEKFIDFKNEVNPARLVFNSQWNSHLDFGDVLELSANFTVQQMNERDMFKRRLEENKPIYLHEFMYPLLQGYDSVHMEVDGEFGGRDQTFNMLAGRNLAKAYKGINKFVITTHFLLSADGESKMSKSIGNCIFIDDSPEDKYGKVMSIPDELIVHYYELATDLSREEIDAKEQELNQSDNPMEQKKALAWAIVNKLHGEEAANEAQQHFERTVQNSETPEQLPQMQRADLISKNENSELIDLKNLLTLTGLTSSNSEAKRLIAAGAVEVNAQKIVDHTAEFNIHEVNLIKAGRRNWIELTE